MSLSKNATSAAAVAKSHGELTDNQQETPLMLISPNLINHKWGILRDYTPNTMEFSSDLVKLIAMLYTDGCVSKHRLNSWRITFSNSSRTAIDLFIDSLVSVFGVSKNRVKVTMMMDRYYFAVLTSKEIGKWLIDRFGTFRTLKFKNGKYPPASIPVDLLITTGNVQTFLKIVFSMDGGVKFYVANNKGNYKWLEKNISLACHHPRLRKQYKKLLKSIGVKSVNITADNVIKIRRKENLEKFAKEIGFINGIATTRHSKFWIGVSKNKVLQMMVDSYRNPSEYISLINSKMVKI